LALASYTFGKSVDKLQTGEWLSVTTLFSNSIGIWALFYPVIRHMIYGAAVDL
jgi:hypothetical protein